MMVGHIALALIPGYVGVTVGLILVAVGSGGLKANATSVVGTLYRGRPAPRRRILDSSTSASTSGAFFGPLVTGLPSQTSLGFHWAFGAAAVGMAFGLIQYSFGRRQLPARMRAIVPDPAPRAAAAGPSRASGSRQSRSSWCSCSPAVIRADNLAVVIIVTVGRPRRSPTSS